MQQQQKQKQKASIVTAAATKTNKEIINEYFDAMLTEINPSINYRKINGNTLNKLSCFHNDKPFANMKREDIISYLNSLRKSEDMDPLHKWIGTYNLHVGNLIRFFKWLYNPTKGMADRPKPDVISNIPKLRRKEQSVYKPSDLWTLEDDLVFLKWCPNTRDRCYHAISRDLSARPQEILDLRIKDVVFRQVGNKHYAEVLVNGKTGSRHLPLIDSLPYLKEWVDKHPQRNNKNACLICSMNRSSVGGPLTRNSLLEIYSSQYKKKYFPMLLRNPTISNEDKQKIRDLLRKPWNLYIRRHSSLTQKSKYLKEHILRQHAGWSPRSQMHLKYVHYFGNESSESILQEYGILPKDNAEADVLKPKQCPNCNEPNRPDQKFCIKCMIALTYDAYSETLESEKHKEDKLTKMEEEFSLMQSQMQTILSIMSSANSQDVKEQIAKQLIQQGVYRASN
jgi:integrase/recombinase XerD